MLYDSVPGGTGYLHQLLTGHAGTLADVLRMSLDALTACPCNQDAEKDGCYRCLYQYRLGRKMDLVSRDQAKAILTELVASFGQLEKVKTISEIFINPNFDSVLEARFIESLRRLGLPIAAQASGLPVTRLVQDIVNGKSGWLLKVGEQRYKIQPQCELGPLDGVSVPSKPDFVMWPWPAQEGKRPVAVFCDGWAYHRDVLHQDAVKRSALVASGGFWVWSVTHEDVQAALDGKTVTDLESPLVRFARHDGSLVGDKLKRAEQDAFTFNAVASLIHWLGLESDLAQRRAQTNALWATFLMSAPPGSPEAAAVATALEAIWSRSPEWMRSFAAPHLPVLGKTGVQPIVAWRWPAALLATQVLPAVSPGLLLLDDGEVVDEPAFRQLWRNWLRLFNTLQVLPGMLLITEKALAGGLAEGLSPRTPSGAASVSDQAALAAEWRAVLAQAVEVTHSGLQQLAKTGVMPPEVGYELADERGRVAAESELAWPQQHVVVLMVDQADQADIWRREGWTVIHMEDAAGLPEPAATPGWASVVADAIAKHVPEGGKK